MKVITEKLVDDIIKLKFGRLVESNDHTSYVSNRVLGKIFKMSNEMIRQIYLTRFRKIKQ